MSNENKNKPEEKSPASNRPSPRDTGRSPKAAIVWLLIMLIIGSLFLFKIHKKTPHIKFLQNNYKSLKQ